MWCASTTKGDSCFTLAKAKTLDPSVYTCDDSSNFEDLQDREDDSNCDGVTF